MDTILVHLTTKCLPSEVSFRHSNFVFGDIPEYANICIQCCREQLSCEPIVITDEIVRSDLSEQVLEFFNLCKKGFPSFYDDPFWLLTLLRLFVVCEYAKLHNIQKFLHLEYDNLIYMQSTVFEQLPENCYFTKVGPGCGSAGIMYCNDILSLERVINGVKSLLKRGQNVIKEYTSYDFLSEMILIDLLVKGNKADYLPLLPSDKYFNLTECVFDGASYGQYIGGTNNGHEPGWYGLNHYIGTLLHSRQIQIKFDNKKPTATYNNCTSNIFNLHIHSKKLNLYV
jgi:hypothetical protein